MRPPHLLTILPRSAVRALAALASIAALAVPVPATAAPGEGPAAAPDAASAALAPASPDLPGLPPLSRELSAISVDSPAYRRARASYDEAAAALAGAQARRVEIDGARSDLSMRAGVLRATIASSDAQAAGFEARLAEVSRALGDLAVNLYVTGAGSRRIDAALTADQPAINDEDRRHVLGTASLDVLLAERVAYLARLEQATARRAAADAELAELEGQLADLGSERSTVVEAEVAAAAPVAQRRVELEAARALARVDGVDFQLVALDAYHRAASTVAFFEPSCGVRWWAIAGISRVEGHHGTYGGAELDVLGNPSRPIIGIALDGNNATAVIGDSDGGALDGDSAYDRAVGPMQFIPQTWSRFAADGNQDGVATPFNLYDATLAAARYLCTASHGLDADDGLRAAYFSYNHSVEYVDRVLSFARGYERAAPVPAPTT